SASLEVLARGGLIAYGVVHLLIGWLALQIAWGAAGNSADTSGALTTLADQPFGKILLWLVAGGMVALALWQAAAPAAQTFAADERLKVVVEPAGGVAGRPRSRAEM
ncbi:MAG TPA: DUF1206 domain-containing protein, partial [Propionibacteriaceae bacterium]|nr:DUF1206 domain-containing protein [Propionibacteriaceae bacterium]